LQKLGLNQQEVNKKWQEDVEKAGGGVAYMKQLIENPNNDEYKIDDVAHGSGSVGGYKNRQDPVNNNLATQYADRSGPVVHVPGGRGSGHDATLIHVGKRRVEALEIKKGALNGLDVVSSKKSTVPKEKRAVTFDPSKDRGPEALRHLDKPPDQKGKDRRADELVSGGVLVKEGDDGQKRTFENKVSSISENLKTNLQVTREKLEEEYAELQGKIGTISDPKRKKKLKAVRDNIQEAIELLADIITGAGGELQLIVALEPGAEASAAQIEVVNRLLEAGVRRLRTQQQKQETVISHAIQEIDDQGNFIKSR
jgi:hypothetical protein